MSENKIRKVLKFGGTSIGTVDRLKALSSLLSEQKNCIVVLSAMAGTTDKLVSIAEHLYVKKNEQAALQIDDLEQSYSSVAKQLLSDKALLEEAQGLIKSHFDFIRSFTQDSFTPYEEKAILAQGELLSTSLFHLLAKENGLSSALLPALKFMRIDKSAEPDEYYIKESIQRELDATDPADILITQGYICRNAFGEIDNFKRGGSDYTASLIGAALDVEEIQIWTDISGLHNNDPRIVDETHPISQISFDEAAELAYFGAKILHPSSIRPARDKSIPVVLKNTMKPEDQGTFISENGNSDVVSAIAAKDGITALKIKSGRMLMAYGFLRKVFEIFERYRTPIDMITTSEVAVSLTIDDIKHLDRIQQDLIEFGTVEIDEEQSIVCIVGRGIAENTSVLVQVMNSLENIPLRMISVGGSKHNISILVNSKDKSKTLQLLNKKLFKGSYV